MSSLSLYQTIIRLKYSQPSQCSEHLWHISDLTLRDGREIIDRSHLQVIHPDIVVIFSSFCIFFSQPHLFLHPPFCLFYNYQPSSDRETSNISPPLTPRVAFHLGVLSLLSRQRYAFNQHSSTERRGTFIVIRRVQISKGPMYQHVTVEQKSRSQPDVGHWWCIIYKIIECR